MCIGILGGTFDPIHMGHLILAEEAMEQANLDRIVFMPAKVSPFKQNCKVAHEKHRLEMVKRSIASNDHFFVSDLEMNLDKVSYTINTLKNFKATTSQAEELFFILGTDAFLGIEKWYEAEELFKHFNFIVGSRPGYKTEELDLLLEKINKKAHITSIQNRLIEISSTEIRERVKRGESITYLVAKPIEEYINAFKVY